MKKNVALSHPLGHFSKEIREKLEEAIEKIDQPLAAFDADGTLWPRDVGKDFFQYQVEKALLRDKISDPRAEFNRINKEQGRRASLLWLAQIQSGFSLKMLNQWIEDFLQENPF